MITGSSNGNRHQVPFLSLLPFLLITFGLAWGIIALFILLPDQMTSLFGELTGQHPLFFLAVYAPAIAAFIVVIYYGGAGGFRRYLVRLFLWRCSPVWYAFLIIGIPLLFFGGSVLKGNLFAEPLPFSSFQTLVVALLFMAVKRPGRRVWLAWIGSAAATAQVCTILGRADSWCYLGLMALSSIPVERDAAKRLVIHSVFCGLGGCQRDRDSIIQRIAWQYTAPRTVAFSADQSNLA